MMLHAHSAILEQYTTALDRKQNPVGGKSYTNYLYNAGLDKILKKCGEEAFETVIAAKNDDMNDTIGEINDVLYHVVVLLCYQGVTMDAVLDALNVRCASEGLQIDELFQRIAERRDIKDGESYTAYLFDKGLDKILKKVGEACSLLLIAGKAGDVDSIAYETADLLYHILVMMLAKNIPLEAVADEFDRRSGKKSNLKVFHTTNVNS